MTHPGPHSDHCSCRLANGGEGVEYNDNPHLLAVIDKSPARRKAVAAAVMSFYNVMEFEPGGMTLTLLRDLKPGIVLVGEEGTPFDGFELVHKMRQDGELRQLPVILILEDGSLGKASAAKQSGASAWIAKPYRRSELIRLISSQLNAAVEREWERLPLLQSRALKGTIEIFNGLSDVIDRGEPILYDEMSEACTSLVEAVNADNFKGILNGVKSHDNYTYAHSLRVAVFLSLFGRTIGLPAADQKILATGGLLHDVGKMTIPHLVLNKPGRLTEAEFSVMKGHVDETIRILQAGDRIPKGVITIAAQHHEKLDGSGYPLGLKGTELNKLARMASIVDVFSALTDRRVYKPPMTPEAALAIMSDEMANHLDMDLLATFRQMLLDAAANITT